MGLVRGIGRNADFAFCLIIRRTASAGLRKTEIFLADGPIIFLSIVAPYFENMREKSKAAAESVPHRAAGAAFVGAAERQSGIALIEVIRRVVCWRDRVILNSMVGYEDCRNRLSSIIQKLMHFPGALATCGLSLSLRRQSRTSVAGRAAPPRSLSSARPPRSKSSIQRRTVLLRGPSAPTEEFAAARR